MMTDAAHRFMKKRMHAFKKGEMHSGSEKGPVVKGRDQAVAISMDEMRRKGMKVPMKQME